jgi:3-oxoacid CoA-transferase B subunit
MDLAVGAKKIFVMTTHTTKEGTPKLLKNCSFPLTAKGVVSSVYSDLATIDIRDGKMNVRYMVPNLTEEELQSKTDAELTFDV